jgi:predicted NBD/HSP70 family sugar kinase
MDGDPTATDVLEYVTHYLGLGIANLVNLLNPSCIVLGGWCGNALAPYVLPRLEHMVREYALSEPASVVEFRKSELGANGVSLGAACLVLETFLAGELLSLFESPVKA